MNKSFFLTLIAFILLSFTPSAGIADIIKMSSSGICHCPGGSYYSRTKNFTPYDTITACLAAGGNHPSRGQGSCQTLPTASKPHTAPKPQSLTNPTPTQAYNRNAFGGWADTDGDCLNTRHELLADLSTGPVTYKNNQCLVTHGRWNDPYTGKIYTEAKDLDIDHLIPLAYAWERGASTWTQEKRIQFANDPVNLFAVQASANRQKGAKGPTEWMPPNTQFHCQYLLRFRRVALTYDLHFSPNETRQLDALRQKACK